MNSKQMNCDKRNSDVCNSDVHNSGKQSRAGSRAMFGRWFVLFFVVLICLSVDVASACPTCANGIATHQGMMQGYFWSILFMLSMPFSIFAALATYFYFQIRAARAQGWGKRPELPSSGSAATPTSPFATSAMKEHSVVTGELEDGFSETSLSEKSSDEEASEQVPLEV